MGTHRDSHTCVCAHVCDGLMPSCETEGRICRLGFWPKLLAHRLKDRSGSAQGASGAAWEHSTVLHEPHRHAEGQGAFVQKGVPTYGGAGSSAVHLGTWAEPSASKTPPQGQKDLEVSPGVQLWKSTTRKKRWASFPSLLQSGRPKFTGEGQARLEWNIQKRGFMESQ